MIPDVALFAPSPGFMVRSWTCTIHEGASLELEAS